jgi:hypothetical protein
MVGGVLGNEEEARTILRATITTSQINLPATMWQFLTVYEEEKEVRVREHTPIIISGIEVADAEYDGEVPPLPITANTGDAPWDDDGLRRAIADAFADPEFNR